MNIVTRARWGARYAAGTGPLTLPVAEVWLHHTVTLAPDLAFTDLNGDSTDDDEARAMRQVEQIGQDRFGAGFSYTFAVMPSGRVYQGTGPGRVGTHTQYRNSRSHAIVLVGNYEENEPTPQMLRAVAHLLRHGKAAGWWGEAKLNGGHRDLKQTACPGIRAYRRIADINRMAALAPSPDPAPIPEEDDMYAIHIDLEPGEDSKPGEDFRDAIEPAVRGFFGSTESLLVLDCLRGDSTKVWIWNQHSGGGHVEVAGDRRFTRSFSGGWLHVRNDGEARVFGNLLVKRV